MSEERSEGQSAITKEDLDQMEPVMRDMYAVVLAARKRGVPDRLIALALVCVMSENMVPTFMRPSSLIEVG